MLGAGQVMGYLLRVGATTLAQLITLFGPGLALVAALSMLSGYVTRLASRVFGIHGYLLLFGGLGTAIHEIGHALFMLLFGYHVPKIELFKIDLKSGSLGKTFYVPDENNLFKVIGLFFIGIAPILFGTIIIFSALLILFQADMIELIQRIALLSGDQQAQSVAGGLLYQTLTYCAAILAFIFRPAHFFDWRFYLFLYLTFAIGSSIHLSKSDIKAATSGFVALIILAFVFNLITLWQNDLATNSFNLLSQSYAFLYAILGLTLALNVLAALVLLLPAIVLGGR